MGRKPGFPGFRDDLRQRRAASGEGLFQSLEKAVGGGSRTEDDPGAGVNRQGQRREGRGVPGCVGGGCGDVVVIDSRMGDLRVPAAEADRGDPRTARRERVPHDAWNPLIRSVTWQPAAPHPTPLPAGRGVGVRGTRPMALRPRLTTGLPLSGMASAGGDAPPQDRVGPGTAGSTVPALNKRRLRTWCGQTGFIHFHILVIFIRCVEMGRAESPRTLASGHQGGAGNV